MDQTADTVWTSSSLGLRHILVKADLIWALVRRELKVKYRGSILGYLWSTLNPLLFMITISFVFSFVMRFKMEYYSLYVLSGILFGIWPIVPFPWGRIPSSMGLV